MNNTLILHHYDNSPYAEKIRLMFGLANSRWHSMLSPVQPPRPNLDPLTGGYRRIPVAQLGADIFCDTATITREVAALTQCAALDPEAVDETAARLMQQAEQEAFIAGFVAIPPLRALGTAIKLFGPLGAVRFAKDRAGLMKDGSMRPPQPAAGKKIFRSFVDDTLESTLSEREWIGGNAASIADFTVYHPLWLHASFSRKPLNAGPKVTDWYQRVGVIGHGQREEIEQAQAFAAAKDSDPRPLPDSVDNPPIDIGASVSVGPSDYGTRPVTGTLAAVTGDRIIIRRDTSEFKTLHVHFPRSGYSMNPG